MIRAAALALLVAGAGFMAGPVLAQQDGSIFVIPPDEEDGAIIRPVPRDGTDNGEALLEPDLDLNFVPEVGNPDDPQITALNADGAVLRALDRTSNEVADLRVAPGETVEFGRLHVTLGECRYPEDNPAGDAYAFLVIRTAGEEEPLFQGWMIASSPALNAMDDPRYDVWVLSCNIS